MAEALFTRYVPSPSILPIEKGGTGGTSKWQARTNLEVEKITNLYSNNSGTNGTITLSQTFANFGAIRVYYRVNEGERKSEMELTYICVRYLLRFQAKRLLGDKMRGSGGKTVRGVVQTMPDKSKCIE